MHGSTRFGILLRSTPCRNLTSPHSKLTGEKRCCPESSSRLETSCKRIKMRDLDSIFRSEGTETHPSKSSKIEEVTAQVHLSKDEETSQITEAHSMRSSRFQEVTMEKDEHTLLGSATCLSLGNVDSNLISLNHKIKECPGNNPGCDSVSAHVSDVNKPSVPRKVDNGLDLNRMTSPGPGVNLNRESAFNDVDPQNPFYPYKNLCHLKSGVSSECGSSTGPLEETEPLRLWKAMKQNGFLSSSHGGIPIPKQRLQQRKSKANTFKKKTEAAKREQAHRFTKLAAPSGLLSGLNPGIINHVRNSKQVHSIIEALVRSEKLDGQNKQAGQLRRGSKDLEDPIALNRLSIPSCSENIGAVNQSHLQEGRFHFEPSAATQFTSMDDMLTLKLSPVITSPSENARCLSSEDFLPNQESINSLSIKAATVASQWLELLHQDISGRLSALRRSRKRVRAAITTEFPSLMSSEFLSNQEKEPCSAKLSTVGCSNDASTDMHVAKWKALFAQMDKALSEEGKHLENWLRQVKEMQLHCERGLQFVNFPGADGFQQLGLSEKDSRSKKLETLERECAVRAAAASIYSTCNLVMAAENVSCF